MVMRLLHETPGLLDGAVVTAATMQTPDNFLFPDLTPAAAPLILVHGTKDPITPYQGGRMARWQETVFQVGGNALSAPATAAYFAVANGISAAPQSVTTPGTEVERTEYRQRDRPPVTLHTVHGGGHTVPGPGRAPGMLGRVERGISVADLLADMMRRI